eukprot:4958700-Pyramimonas_sp.AAC.1
MAGPKWIKVVGDPSKAFSAWLRQCSHCSELSYILTYRMQWSKSFLAVVSCLLVAGALIAHLSTETDLFTGDDGESTYYLTLRHFKSLISHIEASTKESAVGSTEESAVGSTDESAVGSTEASAAELLAEVGHRSSSSHLQTQTPTVATTIHQFKSTPLASPTTTQCTSQFPALYDVGGEPPLSGTNNRGEEMTSPIRLDFQNSRPNGNANHSIPNLYLIYTQYRRCLLGCGNERFQEYSYTLDHTRIRSGTSSESLLTYPHDLQIQANAVTPAQTLTVQDIHCPEATGVKRNISTICPYYGGECPGAVPSKCPQGCHTNGNCNEETGRCDCLLGITGENCENEFSAAYVSTLFSPPAVRAAQAWHPWLPV